jgi:hypothetical protein
MYKVGQRHPVWWETGVRHRDGSPLATIIAVSPYTGNYPESFTHVLRLTAPNTRRGWMEMAV